MCVAKSCIPPHLPQPQPNTNAHSQSSPPGVIGMEWEVRWGLVSKESKGKMGKDGQVQRWAQPAHPSLLAAYQTPPPPQPRSLSPKVSPPSHHVSQNWAPEARCLVLALTAPLPCATSDRTSPTTSNHHTPPPVSLPLILHPPHIALTKTEPQRLGVWF